MVIVGDDSTVEDRACKITWILSTREECIQLIKDMMSHDPICPQDRRVSSRCGMQQKPMEREYFIFIVAIAIILPISGTIIAYYGLIAKVKATDSYFVISITVVSVNTHLFSNSLKARGTIFQGLISSQSGDQ